MIYPRLHKQFYVFASFSERLDPHGQTKQDEAGVALAFAKCGTSSSEGFVPQVFVPGRVLRVSVAVGDCESIYWCTHNFGVSAAQMDSIEIAFRADQAWAAENPRAVTVFAMGDFNYVCEGEYQRSLELPNDTRLGSHSLPTPRAWQSRWEHILKDLTELAQPLDTHYSNANSLCSRIDRIYTSIPPWLLIQLNVNASLYNDPKELYDSDVSDHSPLCISFSKHDPVPADQRPISRHVVADPRYADYLEKLVAASNLDALAVPIRLQQFKLLMREAARLVRDEHSSNFTNNPVALSSMYGTMARAVWNNDSKVASLLIGKYSIAGRHLQIIDDTVTVVNPPRFQFDFLSARQRAAECRKNVKDMEVSQPDAPSVRRRRAESSRAMHNRMMKLWTAFNKKLCITGIKTKSGIVRSPHRMSNALSQHWVPVFDEKPFDSAAADSFLQNYKSSFDFSKMPPPHRRPTFSSSYFVPDIPDLVLMAYLTLPGSLLVSSLTSSSSRPRSGFGLAVQCA